MNKKSGVSDNYRHAFTFGLLLIVIGVPLAFLTISKTTNTKNVLHFPEDTSLGELWLIEDTDCMTCGNGVKRLGDARGQVNVKLPEDHWYVELRMPQDVSQLMPLLSEHPSLNGLHSIVLQGSNITDEGLSYLQGNKLLNIDLGQTTITGLGLQYIEPDPHWISVNLGGCENMEIEHLKYFDQWSRATVFVSNYLSGPEQEEAEHAAIVGKARKVICGIRSERDCIQVR